MLTEQHAVLVGLAWYIVWGQRCAIMKSGVHLFRHVICIKGPDLCAASHVDYFNLVKRK